MCKHAAGERAVSPFETQVASWRSAQLEARGRRRNDKLLRETILNRAGSPPSRLVYFTKNICCFFYILLVWVFFSPSTHDLSGRWTDVVWTDCVLISTRLRSVLRGCSPPTPWHQVTTRSHSGSFGLFFFFLNTKLKLRHGECYYSTLLLRNVNYCSVGSRGVTVDITVYQRTSFSFNFGLKKKEGH